MVFKNVCVCVYAYAGIHTHVHVWMQAKFFLAVR